MIKVECDAVKFYFASCTSKCPARRIINVSPLLAYFETRFWPPVARLNERENALDPH
jgi:hypothetical protein